MLGWRKICRPYTDVSFFAESWDCTDCTERMIAAVPFRRLPLLLLGVVPVLAACGGPRQATPLHTAAPSSTSTKPSASPTSSSLNRNAPSKAWPGVVSSVMASLHTVQGVPLMAPSTLPGGEATAGAEPTASGFLVTLKSGVNNVGSFGGLHTPSNQAASSAIFSESSFQNPVGAPTSQTSLGSGSVTARFYGSSDSLIWNSGNWTCEVVGSAHPTAVATPIAVYLASHPLPFSTGVLTVIAGAGTSDTTTLAWNHGANVYTVSQTGAPIAAIQTAAAMAPYPAP